MNQRYIRKRLYDTISRFDHFANVTHTCTRARARASGSEYKLLLMIHMRRVDSRGISYSVNKG